MSAGFVRHAQGGAALLVSRTWCKGCNLCVAACPSGVLSLDVDRRVAVGDIGRCIFCGVCAVRCPDFAILLERPVPEPLEASA
jgi:NAD-dependent dihydropyrimidine dehydrogenase PreA subunit